LAAHVEPGGVQLGAHLYDAAGRMQDFDFHLDAPTEPAREIAPGETVHRRLTMPSLPAGRYRLELDCVASRVTWFAQVGSQPATLEAEVVRWPAGDLRGRR
jgi:hypothetical protein